MNTPDPQPPHVAPLYFIIVILVVGVVGLLVYVATNSQTQPSTTNSGNTGLATTTKLSGVVPTRVPDSVDKSTIIDDINSPSSGVAPSQATVTVVEFLDFQCPYCQESASVVPQLIARYRGQPVRFVFRNLPLESIHQYAVPAAHAALCANDQNKYMDMFTMLYQQQSKINPDSLYGLARDAGLEMNTFSSCMSAGTHRAQIQKDLSDAIALGSKGTPTWFINGQRFEGALSLETFSSLIDTLLGKK